MTRLEKQIQELSPSVKDALYRRLLFAEDLAWLRDENKKDVVIGFEVDLDEQELSGFAHIAIQRHTVIAYVSDRNEEPRLILFPNLETLFDPGFELLDLIVTRKEFRNATFQGTTTGHGRFGEMVKDLTPPNRRVDVSNTVLDQMANTIEKAEEPTDGTPEEPVTVTPVASVTHTPAPKAYAQPEPEPEPEYDEPEYEEGPPEGFIEDDETNNFDDYTEPGYDDYDSYDSYDGYEEPEPEPEPAKPLSRSEQLKAQTFGSLNEVIDFVVLKLGINRPLAVTLANKAMQSKVSPEYRVELAVNIFCKLIDEDKI